MLFSTSLFQKRNAMALRSQIDGSLCIPGNVLWLIVLRSINLDDEVPFVAGEVSEEGTDGGSPPEVRVLDWRASQMPPEFALCVSHVTPQFACPGDTRIEFFFLMFGHAAPTPSPTPSPSPPLARARGGRGAAPPCVPYELDQSVRPLTRPPCRSDAPLPRSAWRRRPRTP
jgi:hypothetical protein